MKKDLKKIKLTFIPVVLYLLGGAVPSFAQRVEIDMFPLIIRSTLHMDISLINIPESEIESSLREGFRSEIRYNIKIYRENNGPFSFLGDKLIMEANPGSEAGWDVFQKSYYIRNDGGEEATFRSRDNFFHNFSRLIDFSLELKLEPGREYYILTNVQISPVKLTPPLTIIEFFLPQKRKTAPWHRASLPPFEERGL